MVSRQVPDTGFLIILARCKNIPFLQGYSGCPNKWNAYHECVPWCKTHWGEGHVEPDAVYLEKFNAMMAQYGNVLPDGWKEEYDPGKEDK